MITLTEQASTINISNILGRFTIQPHERNEILIETTEEEKVEAKVKGNTLYIQTKLKEGENGKQENKGIFSKVFGGVRINNNSGTVVIGNGNVVINGTSTSASDLVKVNMVIHVPYGVIDTVDTLGTVQLDIAGITEEIMLDYSGSTHATIIDIESVELDGSGKGEIFIKNAINVEADLSGKSTIQIESESMKKILVDGSGKSDILIKSKTINKVDLDLSGSGQILIYGKVEKKRIDKSGSVKIDFVE